MRRFLPLLVFLCFLPPVWAGGNGLDQLFQSLKSVGTTEEAKPIEEQILTRFRQSGSPSVDLLMTRAGAAYAAGDKTTALRLMTAVTDLDPNFAEGWHERAVLEADGGDDKKAMASLEKAIHLNGRHFAAMVRLGDYLQEYGDKDGALKLFRRAQALDPRFEGLKNRIDALSRAVEGQGI